MSDMPLTYFAGWLANGERGLSSEAIVSKLTGEPVGYPSVRDQWNHPLDPDDLRRCVRLLDRCPDARIYVVKVGAMRDCSPEWAALTDHWAELEALLNCAEDPSFDPDERAGYWRHCLQRMKAVLSGVEVQG